MDGDPLPHGDVLAQGRVLVVHAGSGAGGFPAPLSLSLQDKGLDSPVGRLERSGGGTSQTVVQPVFPSSRCSPRLRASAVNFVWGSYCLDAAGGINLALTPNTIGGVPASCAPMSGAAPW